MSGSTQPGYSDKEKELEKASRRTDGWEGGLQNNTLALQQITAERELCLPRVEAPGSAAKLRPAAGTDGCAQASRQGHCHQENGRG